MPKGSWIPVFTGMTRIAIDGYNNLSIYSGYMEKTLLNIKTDRELKEEAQKVARELGLPLGTIINAYLRELIREKKVLFSSPPVPNKKTQNLLKKIDHDIRAGLNSKPFTYDEAIEYLDSICHPRA